MRILLIHRSFPGQFRYLAAVLGQALGHDVVFLTTADSGEVPGVRRVVYTPARKAQEPTHHYAWSLENAVHYGQAAYKAALDLKRQGWIPDVIYGHSGWGPTLYMKDLFPQAAFLAYNEWFYRAKGSSHGFNPAVPVSGDNEAEIRTKNAPLLIDLCSADQGISPTRWQRAQFPAEFQSKIAVIHDGVSTDYFLPALGQGLSLPRIGLHLPPGAEVVTYVATGMEPIRGFPQFMEAVSLLQRQRPRCQVVVVGEDRTEYSNPHPSGQTYRQVALAAHEFDLSRLHFTGRLSLEEYAQVLQASQAHVYLTYPFILSWSMLEAMASGCLVVGSATPPVQEFIEDGVNGLLVDFFSPRQLADLVSGVLAEPAATLRLRQRARETILSGYSLQQMLELQVALITGLAR